MSSRHGKAEKWTFKAHGLVAKPFEHARERELCNALWASPLCLALLTLDPLRVRAKP